MILITGASGNVGSEVLKQAMAAKLKLTAAYQSAEKAQSAPGNVHTVVLDYEKPETIRAALEGVDILKEGLILLRGRKRSARPKWLRNSREQRDAPSAMSI